MKILKMDDRLFAQRRRVMGMLYEARKVIGADLPRIKVRIVDFGTNKENLLGLAYIERDYITISHKLTGWSDEALRHVVWHELGHAYFSAKHDEKCPLMAPKLNEPGKREVLAKALRKLAKRAGVARRPRRIGVPL